MLNLNIFLSFSARNYPQKAAFIQGEEMITFEELERNANKVANGLNGLGIMQGDRVALSCSNLFYFPIIYYGILKTGAIVVPLNILLKPNEIARQLEHSDSKAFFCFEGTPELPVGKWGRDAFLRIASCEQFISLPAVATNSVAIESGNNYVQFTQNQSGEYACCPTEEADTAILLYTSGTTGDPKGIEISHSAIAWNAQASIAAYKSTVDDVIITPGLPLFHIFGQSCNMNGSIYGGMTNVLLSKFDPVVVLREMHKQKVSIITAVPTMYWQLLQSGNTAETKDLLPEIRQNLRRCIGGGAKVSPQISRDFYEMFGIKIYEGLGISENSGVVSLCPVDKEPTTGSIGIPVIGTEMKIIKDDGTIAAVNEIGELCIRGACVMKGYYKNPEATQKAILPGGWIRSGDIGYVDETGNYFIVDRIKDLIIRGGRNIYPIEIEEVMMTHPSISMVAVIGVPDKQYGEEVKAYIIPKQGHSLSAEEVKEWVKKEVAGYKYPRYIEFVDSLPVTASGKISKKDLRALQSGAVNHIELS